MLFFILVMLIIGQELINRGVEPFFVVMTGLLLAVIALALDYMNRTGHSIG